MAPASIKSATTAAAVILLTGMIIQQRQVIVATYRNLRGMEGILRYIWIGDYLPRHLREVMEKLDTVNERMTEAEVQLEEIEIIIERVELNSVDGPRSLLQEQQTVHDKDELQERLFQLYPGLRTKIGLLSNRLDTLASAIDSIDSHNDSEVKTRKKKLTNKVVELMKSLDRMVGTLGARP
jgi:uncharacterized protein YicC (UPF0701 family)